MQAFSESWPCQREKLIRSTETRYDNRLSASTTGSISPVPSAAFDRNATSLRKERSQEMPYLVRHH